MITKQQVESGLQALIDCLEAIDNPYLRSDMALTTALNKMRSDLEKWDSRTKALDDFIALIQTHDVYQEISVWGYGDGASTALFIDGQKQGKQTRAYYGGIEYHPNYDAFIEEIDEDIADEYPERVITRYRLKGTAHDQ